MTDSKEQVDIGCLEAIESLYAWLDDELDDAELSAGLEHHLSHCKSCWSRAEMEKSLTERLRLSSITRKDGEDGVPEKLKGRLNQLLDKL